MLRYEVSDGPLDAINLKLPTEWAHGGLGLARRRPLPAPGARPAATPRPAARSTYWAIRPDRPVWGSQRLVVRSSARSRPGEVRSFPDLSPLGWGGAVDTSLRIVNATRQPIAVEGSPGLQPVAPQARHGRRRAGRGGTRARPSVTSYHVIKSGGRSGCRGPAAARPAAGRGSATARSSARSRPTARSSGSGRYDVGPRSGPFLGVEFPAGAAPLWASVNGGAGAALELRRRGAGRSRWPGSRSSRVALVWRSEPAAGARSPAAPDPAPGGGAGPRAGGRHGPRRGGGRGLEPDAAGSTRRASSGSSWRRRGGSAARRPGHSRASTAAPGATARTWSPPSSGSNSPAPGRARRGLDPAATPDPREQPDLHGRGQIARRLRDRLADGGPDRGARRVRDGRAALLGLAPEPPGTRSPDPGTAPLPVQVRPLGRPAEFQGFVGGTSRAPRARLDGRTRRVVRTVLDRRLLALLVPVAAVTAWRLTAASRGPAGSVGSPSRSDSP